MDNKNFALQMVEAGVVAFAAEAGVQIINGAVGGPTTIIAPGVVGLVAGATTIVARKVRRARRQKTEQQRIEDETYGHEGW